jgi:hypothetical protein
MSRLTWVVLTALALAVPTAALAADEAAPAGNWKLGFLNSGRMVTPWIIKFQKKDDKWTAEVLATAEGAPPGATVSKVSITDDQFHFTLFIEKQPFSFEGKLPKEAGKKMLGSLALGGQMVPAELEPTKLKNFDSFDANKEIVAKGEGGSSFFGAALDLLRQAEDKKATPEEVRGWANKAVAASEPYGSRWQREIQMRIASTLVAQEGFAPIALEYARKAKRLLTPEDDFTTQMRVLNVLSSALNKTDKKDEAAAIEKEADAIYVKKMPPFKAEKFEGRKKKSDRAVLVELFTGAQCPPCVAADLAFDALAKTYTPAEVVLLEYHLHVPRPDPLTNEDTMLRAKFYDDEIEGTPTIFFDGKLKPKAAPGGGVDDAKERYEAFVNVINPMLETPAGAKITARATRKGDKVDVSAEASGAKGEKLRLRLVLVEDVVRYTGSNQVRFHHHVVRAMPGGAEGVALKEGAAKQEVTVDLAHVRETINKHLNEYGKKAAFLDDKRPLDLKDLYLVAFVQSDETKEILQSVQVKVEGEAK